MTSLWLISDEEDERMQGLSADAQVMYMRLFRRYADFDTGEVAITHGQMRRCIEFIPDTGSRQRSRRVSDIENNYVRARVAELERAGLITKKEKRNRFEAPAFQCEVLAQGLVRPKSGPQGNHKRGTTKGGTSGYLGETTTSDETATSGTTKEPQGRNHKIPGVPEDSPLKEGFVPEAEGARVIELPLNDGTGFTVTEAKRDEWQALFPGVDVDQALRNMRAWLLESPAKRKTRRGVGRFVVGWLERDQNSGRTPRNGGGPAGGQRSRSSNRQEALEQRNRQVAENWVPPELRRRGGE